MRRPRRLAAAGVLTALALAASACGDVSSEQGDAAGVGRAPSASLGQRSGKITCSDWERGSVAERRGTVTQLTLVAEGNANPDDVGPNRVLPEDKAYEVFEGWCGAYAARGFLLYDLYNRAAVFSSPD